MSRPTTQAFLTISASIVFAVLHFAGCDFLGPCDRVGGCPSGLICDPASWLCLPDGDDAEPCDDAGGCPDGFHCAEKFCAPDEADPLPGGHFNPCDETGGCKDGYSCAFRSENEETGWICAPASCDLCGDPLVLAEADNIGPSDPVCLTDPNIIGEWCVVPCAGPADCNLDAVCLGGACVYAIP